MVRGPDITRICLTLVVRGPDITGICLTLVVRGPDVTGIRIFGFSYFGNFRYVVAPGPPQTTGQLEEWPTSLYVILELQLNTLRTGLLNCLNARSRGLTFRHRASCI